MNYILIKLLLKNNKQQKIKQKRISLGKHILELTVKCHLLNTFFLKVYSLFFFSALTSQQSLEILLAPFGLYFTVGERETHSPGWTGKTPWRKGNLGWFLLALESEESKEGNSIGG